MYKSESVSEKIYSIDEIRDIVLPIINKYKTCEAVLFGSYARNEADKDSDVDVMIVGGKMFESTDIFCIADELYQALRKPVDVFEETEIDHESDFYNNILKEGISLK